MGEARPPIPGRRWIVKSALDVHTVLLAGDVPHEVVRLSTRLGTADDLPRVLGLAGGCLAVRCYVVQRGSGADGRVFVAVIVAAGAVPSPSALLEALDACTLRAAGSDEVNAATDFAAGLVSPVDLPPGVVLLADAAVREHDVSYCAVGEAGVALGIRTRDLLSATGARVLPLSGPAAAPRPAVSPGPAASPLPSAAPQPSAGATVLWLDRAAGARSTG